MKVKNRIDTDTLNGAQADEILRLVDEADFFALPASMPPPARGADRFQYQLTISDGDRTHSALLYESDELPESLKTLLKQVAEIARKNPPL